MTRNASESSFAGGGTGLEVFDEYFAVTAGLLITRCTAARNAAGSSSGIIRTSSVAFASDGMTFERYPPLMIVGEIDV